MSDCLPQQRNPLSVSPFAIVFTLSLFPLMAFADNGSSSINVDQMLANIAEQVPYLMEFVSSLAYLIGFYLMFSAVYKLRAYGELRTMSSMQSDLRGPMITLAVGAALIFLPTAIDVGLTTVFGSDSIISYEPDSSSWDQLAETLILIVQLVGAVAFVRGLIQFNRLGAGQAQPGMFGKALAHVIGGIIALNIVGATQIIFSTLGID